jgi:membrane protease YdiL (CAAX protease family)
MNTRLALLALASTPLLALMFRVLTGAFDPMSGYALGLCFYWILLAIAVVASTTSETRSGLTTARSVGPIIATLCVLPVLILGLPGMAALDRLPALLLVGIAVAAATNGFLEELFWRGALVPNPTLPQAAGAVVLFAFWHVALLAAQGVSLPGGPATLLLGAAFLGSVWMAARLSSGTVGLSALSHAGVNLFAFIILAAENLASEKALQAG